MQNIAIIFIYICISILYKSKATSINRHTSNISKVACFGNGRLGNQLCNFASQYALFKEFGMPSYISEYSNDLLRNTFLLKQSNSRYNNFSLWVKHHEDISPLSWVHISNEILTYNRSEFLSMYKYSWFIKLEPYVCDIKGFFPYLGELRNTYFRFQTKVQKEAKNVMRHLQQNRDKSTIFVSIHIRMTDIEYHLSKLFGLSMASKEYFTRAMSRMTERLGSNIKFLAFSDDIQKAQTMLLSKENENFDLEFPLVDGTSPTTRITLALLSLCEGSILTYSTFGLWGALLRKNQRNIIMPKEILRTDIGKYVSNSDFKVHFM